MDKILSPIKKRIIQYLDYKGITKTSFCKETGISISNFKGNSKKSELGGDKIVDILTIYKNINPSWLLLGEGEIEKTKNNIEEEPLVVNESPSHETSIESLLAKQVVKLINPAFSDMQKQINLIYKSLGEIRLDLDDFREEVQDTNEESVKRKDQNNI